LGDTKNLITPLIRSTPDEGRAGHQFHINMANFSRATTTYSHCENLKPCLHIGRSYFNARNSFLKNVTQIEYTYIHTHRHTFYDTFLCELIIQYSWYSITTDPIHGMQIDHTFTSTGWCQLTTKHSKRKPQDPIIWTIMALVNIKTTSYKWNTSSLCTPMKLHLSDWISTCATHILHNTQNSSSFCRVSEREWNL
jgi:hypothetical protein